MAKKIVYEATKWADGEIMNLYRKTEDGSYEEFVVNKGWENTVDAFDAFHGAMHTFRVSEEEANKHVEQMES